MSCLVAVQWKSYLIKCVYILSFTEHEQDTLHRESVDSTERPRKKKSYMCKSCGQPKKGHSRSSCSADTSNL